MKKLIAAEPDKVIVAEVEPPVIAADEALVSPGSELNRVRKLPDDTDDKWPNHDLGYTMCGEVVEVGAEVAHLKPGDRVATMEHHQEGDAARGRLRSASWAQGVPRWRATPPMKVAAIAAGSVR